MASRHSRHRGPVAVIVVSVVVLVGLVSWLSLTQSTTGLRKLFHVSAHVTPQRTITRANRRGAVPTPRRDPPTQASTTTTAVTTPPVSPFGPAVTDVVDGRQGSVTAAILNINTGQEFEFHPGITEDEASIVKVDIMATLLSEQQGGSVPASATEQSLLSSMIEDSDNDSATALWNQVGGPSAIAAFNQRVQMTATTPSSCVTCANFPWPGWGLTTTTASDQLKLLQQFVPGDSLLSPIQRSYGLGLMENIAPSESWGVSGGVPTGVTVALKNGWLPLSGYTDWQVNSIGWIDGDGRNYLLAVLTSGNPTEEYGIETIDTMSTLLWNELG